MRETHQYVVIHYGEVSIKGKNRPTFLHRLVRNVQQALGDLGTIEVQMLSGRCLVAGPIEVPLAHLEGRLPSGFGLVNFSRSLRAPQGLESFKQTGTRTPPALPPVSFRLTAK